MKFDLWKTDLYDHVRSLCRGPEFVTRSIWKMLGPFATASRFTLPFTRCRYCRTPPLSHAACASMSTTTTTTTRDRGDRYGPMEWAQLYATAWFMAFWVHLAIDCSPWLKSFELRQRTGGGREGGIDWKRSVATDGQSTYSEDDGWRDGRTDRQTGP